MKFRLIFIHSPIKYIVSLVVSLLLMVLYCAIRNTWSSPMMYSNGLFIGGFTMVSVGLLNLLNNFGAYDMWAYVFTRKRKKEGITLAEYSEIKAEERKKTRFSFVPFVTVGLFAIIVSAIILIILMK